MPISHIKTVTIADGTNTDVVRPTDWNSAHAVNLVGSEVVGVFSNANGVSFGTEAGGKITASHNALTTAALSNHSHGITLALTNLNGTTGGNSNGVTVSLSAAAQSVQTQNMVSVQGSTGNISFNNANGITFGANLSTITASHNGLTSQSNQAAQGQNGSFTFQTLSFSNANGISAGTSAGNAITFSHNGLTSQSVQTQNSVQIQGSSGAISFGNANGVTFGFNASTITASHNGLTSQSNQAASGSNGSFTFQTLGFSNANGISIGTSAGNSITFSHNALTTAALSNHSHGNPTLALTNLSGTTASASNGFTLSLSAAAPGGGGAVNVSAGTTSGNLQTIQFDNANGVSFGLNGSTVTASHNALTSLRVSGINGSFDATALSFTNRAGAPGNYDIQFLTSAGSLVYAQNTNMLTVGEPTVQLYAGTTNRSSDVFTFGNNAQASFQYSNNSIVLTDVKASLYAVGNTTQSSSRTVNLSNLSFRGDGVASVGVSNGSVVISVPAGGGGLTNINVSAGTTSQNLSNVVFSNSNGVSFGLNGSTVTASVNAGGGGGTATFWWPFNEGVNVAGQQGNGTIHFCPLPTPTPAAGGELHIDRLVFPVYFTNASNTTGTVTLSIHFGLYTFTNGSISLLMSTSISKSLGYAGNNNSSAQRGIRLLTVPWTTTIPDNRYYVGILTRTSTAGGNATISQILVSQINSNHSGFWDYNTVSASRIHWPMGLAIGIATYSTLPNVFTLSNLSGSQSIVARPPSWFAISSTAGTF